MGTTHLASARRFDSKSSSQNTESITLSTLNNSGTKIVLG